MGYEIEEGQKRYSTEPKEILGAFQQFSAMKKNEEKI